MQGTILEFLKKSAEYVSGDYMSQRIGISRQALWKHIQDLKEIGYHIEAVPHLGYRLLSAPDRLFTFEVAHALGTSFIGRRISYLDRVDSTMNACVRLGMDGAPEGTVVIAESQTRGRGRMGRLWESPKYKGIYLSLLLRPKLSPSQASLLTLMISVSVVTAIERVTTLAPRIKWPNDVYIGSKKVAGILTELNAEMDRINFLVIGLGINVNNDKNTLPQGAISLKEEKGELVSRLSLVQQLLREIEKDYCQLRTSGPEEMRHRWRALSMTLGERVKVAGASRQIEGMALDIASDGALIIKTDAGIKEKVYAGDVLLCR
jgi:BirA family transcriptional regulator, biotin operon repressor / biotin---[acetyl-CoA-carboxylase] ligase